MPWGEEITDSPTGWVAEHVRSYVESGGKRGHRCHGTNTLLLTTRGRRSGRLRRTALIYGRDDDRYVLVASNGGASQHPSWYLNLAANPEVELQVGPNRFPAITRTATGEERSRLWQTMASIFPQYDAYGRKAKREIPVVVAERA